MQRIPNSPEKPIPRPKRRGTAAVEFGLCAPFLLAIVFGAIELSNVVYLKLAVTAASYEGINVLSAAGGTQSVAIQRAQGVLQILGVKNPYVFASYADASTATGTWLIMYIEAPVTGNTATGWCLQNITYDYSTWGLGVFTFPRWMYAYNYMVRV